MLYYRRDEWKLHGYKPGLDIDTRTIYIRAGALQESMGKGFTVV